MIDPDGVIADGLRTLWIWLLVGPALQPLASLLPELGFALGVTLPAWSGILVGGVVAGGLVGTGERRYGRLVVAAVVTLVLWIVAVSALGLTDTRVYGSPRFVLAQLSIWISAVSLAVASVFYVDWNVDRVLDRGEAEPDPDRG